MLGTSSALWAPRIFWAAWVTCFRSPGLMSPSTFHFASRPFFLANASPPESIDIPDDLLLAQRPMGTDGSRPPGAPQTLVSDVSYQGRRNGPSLSRSGTACGQELGDLPRLSSKSQPAGRPCLPGWTPAPYLLLLSRVVSASCKGHLPSARPRVYRAKINTSPLARVDPHLIIRVSRSLDPEKTNFLFVRDAPATDDEAARAHSQRVKELHS